MPVLVNACDRFATLTVPARASNVTPFSRPGKTPEGCACAPLRSGVGAVLPRVRTPPREGAKVRPPAPGCGACSTPPDPLAPPDEADAPVRLWMAALKAFRYRQTGNQNQQRETDKA